MEVKINCKGADTLSIAELKDFQGELKTITPDNLDKLKRSIKKHGFTAPIFVWDNDGVKNILDGHQRLKALIDMQGEGVHVPELPVVYIYADNEKDAKEKLLYITSQYGEFTNDGFTDFTNDLEFDFSDIRLSDGEFDFSFTEDEQEETTGDDEAPEVQEDAVSKLGEIYELGPHRLMCGDSTDAEQVARLMGGEKADMVFTDPPYGVDYEGGSKKWEKLVDDQVGTDIYTRSVPIMAEFCNGPIYTWYADTKPQGLYNAVEKAGDIHSLLIWKKNNSTFNMSINYKQKHEPCLYWKPKGKTLKWSGPSNEDTVWEIKRESRNDFHPTQKPVELAERAIRNHSVGLILDLFGGSGSTLIACGKTNRQCRMMELDPKYCDVIRRRWTKWATENGKKIGSGGLSEISE